jgi:hypothetical protein
MSPTRSILLTGAAVVALAAQALGAQATTEAPVSVLPAAPSAPRGTGPNGATLRCRDGSYPAANSPDTACDGKGGVLVRYPVVRPSGEATARANAAAAAATAAARQERRREPADSVTPPPGFVPYSQRRAAARDTLRPPPDGATLLCGDGSYVVRDTTAARCQDRGGVQLRLEAAKRP